MISRILAIIILLTALPALSSAAQHRYAGGDISLLPDYEAAGAKYSDHDGRPIARLLPWLREQGMNAMRVRLFVDPDRYAGSDRDPNAKQSLDYILPLCREITAFGMALMLDFHYSDTWADPAKQWTPERWKDLDDNALCDSVAAYTRHVLATLKANGVTPAFMQPGNEISYGMLWGPVGTTAPKKALMGSNANWDRFGRLLRAAIGACREECPDAQIILHTERVSAPDVMRNFYNEMARMGIDYDIIGLSYYPYFHGKMTVLDRALGILEKEFPEKEIMVVETGFPYKWEVPGSTEKVDYPYTEEGQNRFARELVTTLEAHPAVDGLFWWWMEYNAYGTSLSGWYNAPLFDSTTGRATEALTTICSFADGQTGIAGPETDAAAGTDSRWFTVTGAAVENPSAPGIYIRRGRKLLVR